MELCVIATLDEYLKRTKVWTGKDKIKLILVFVKLHNPVVNSTISVWIKNVLWETSGSTEISKGHSTRSASTSKAVLGELSVTDVLERGSGSYAST